MAALAPLGESTPARSQPRQAAWPPPARHSSTDGSTRSSRSPCTRWHLAATTPASAGVRRAAVLSRLRAGNTSDLKPMLVDLAGQEHSFLVHGATWLAARELGELDDTRAIFERLAAEDFEELPPRPSPRRRPPSVATIAVALGDHDRAASLRRQYDSYSGTVLTVSARRLRRRRGTIPRPAGHDLRRSSGRRGAVRARDRLEQELGSAPPSHGPVLVCTPPRGPWSPESRRRATELLDASIETAQALGWPRLLDQAVELRAAVTTSSAPDAPRTHARQWHPEQCRLQSDSRDCKPLQRSAPFRCNVEGADFDA